jgi:hypothetical protein
MAQSEGGDTRMSRAVGTVAALLNRGSDAAQRELSAT